MKYISTRGNYKSVKSAEAIKLGMVPRGGLFVPESIPEIEIHDLYEKISFDGGMSYQDLAFEILRLFLTDFSDEELRDYIDKAYNDKRFDSIDISPMRFLTEKLGVLELWHGPTAAFKDMALQIMPHFLKGAAEKLDSEKETLILVATSGDTGKAALEGFRDVIGTQIIVFYPKNGVSKVQELQMLTTEGKNTYSVAVDGNFDDCQTMVKSVFADSEFNKVMSNAGYEFSSANSINWGRLVPQIIYYFWAYYLAVQNKSVFIGDAVNLVVPTGNFGNILAGYYAYNMGLPVNRFICASNKNRVLSEFIDTGTYDRKRKFYRTSSPSMDILISSNLERFLFEITGHNPVKVSRWYEELGKKGIFKVDDITRQKVSHLFSGGFASEEDTAKAIKDVFDKYGYLIDTHTAVGYAVYENYLKETGDETPTILDSTASPFKFNQAVYGALTGEKTEEDEISLLDKLEKLSGVPVHRAVNHLLEKEVRHHREILLKDARKTIKEILSIK